MCACARGMVAGSRGLGIALCLQGMPGTKGEQGDPGQRGHNGIPVSPGPLGHCLGPYFWQSGVLVGGEQGKGKWP